MNEQHLDAELLVDLVDSWAETAMKKQLSWVGFAREIAKKILEWAAPLLRQQGADQELEACCEWVEANFGQLPTHNLRQFRRPKPPSLKEQALADLEILVGHGRSADTIRRALEQLDD